MLCNSCGYRNKDTNINCISCGKRLDPKLSDEQLATILKQASDKSDALIASEFDKKIKWLFFVSAIISLISNRVLSEHILIGLMSAVYSILAGLLAGYPKQMWNSDKWRFSLYTNSKAEDITPNELWGFHRKIGYWTLFAFSIFFTVVPILIRYNFI